MSNQSASHHQEGFHHTPNFGEEDFELSSMYHQQMYNMNHQQGMSGHHGQQSQYDHQSSYSQMPHDSGGYVIQQLGNPMEVGHHHMQPTPQAFEMVNHNSVWSQRSSPPQAVLAASPSGESEDSDDSAGQNQVGQKRPSPDMEDPMRGPGAAKRAKPVAGTKKKKKRDPNEPTKPVSAYALFFRDTQAAIKGQNPNASFGEVSKIVASMWDALDAEHKNVYKKKTEAAKKEYLKQLAAYRASLVSKGNEQEPPPPQQQTYQNRPGPGYGQYPPYAQYGPPSHSPPGMAQHQQMMAHQAAMNRHMIPGQQMGNPGPMIGGPQHPPMMQQQHMGGPPMGNGQPMVPSPGQQGHMGHNSPAQIPNRSPVMNSIQMQEQQQSQQQHNQGMAGRQQQSHQQQQQQYMQQQHQHQQGIPTHQQMPMQQASSASPSTGQVAHQQGGQTMQQQQQLSEGQHSRCIRAGCANPAVHSPEWEDEYCSNECVVSHCRDVFNAWVASNQAQGGSSFPAPVK